MGYIRQVYPDAFHEFTHLMGTPGPELDKNWEQMYDLPSRIPKSQADLLEQPTIELPGDEGHYVILLDIFHSLHCLNEIRKSLHPEYYPPYHVRMDTTEKLAMGHLGKYRRSRCFSGEHHRDPKKKPRNSAEARSVPGRPLLRVTRDLVGRDAG